MPSPVYSIFQEKLALYQQQKREISKERGKLNQMFKTNFDYSNRRGRSLKKTTSGPIGNTNTLLGTKKMFIPTRPLLNTGVYKSQMAPADPRLIRNRISK